MNTDNYYHQLALRMKVLSKYNLKSIFKDKNLLNSER